jgi:branched-chain amino acid transport system permease protein
VLVVAAIGPLIFNDYWVNTILTQTFFFGVAAASLIFLSAYGGMISLAQAALYGIAGFALGNMVNTGAAKGMNLGWDPNLSIVLAILITVAVGLLFGALASRSFGIYFLMITLIYGLIVFFFFGQVTKVSGFSGISGMNRFAPDLLAGNGTRLYYTSLIVAVLVYALIRFVLITPLSRTVPMRRGNP